MRVQEFHIIITSKKGRRMPSLKNSVCFLLARARDPAHLSRMRAHDLCIPAGERSCPEDVMGDEPREGNIPR